MAKGTKKGKQKAESANQPPVIQEEPEPQEDDGGWGGTGATIEEVHETHETATGWGAADDGPPPLVESHPDAHPAAQTTEAFNWGETATTTGANDWGQEEREKPRPPPVRASEWPAGAEDSDTDWGPPASKKAEKKGGGRDQWGPPDPVQSYAAAWGGHPPPAPVPSAKTPAWMSWGHDPRTTAAPPPAPKVTGAPGLDQAAHQRLEMMDLLLNSSRQSAAPPPASGKRSAWQPVDPYQGTRRPKKDGKKPKQGREDAWGQADGWGGGGGGWDAGGDWNHDGHDQGWGGGGGDGWDGGGDDGWAGGGGDEWAGGGDGWGDGGGGWGGGGGDGGGWGDGGGRDHPDGGNKKNKKKKKQKKGESAPGGGGEGWGGGGGDWNAGTNWDRGGGGDAWGNGGGGWGGDDEWNTSSDDWGGGDAYNRKVRFNSPRSGKAPALGTTLGATYSMPSKTMAYAKQGDVITDKFNAGPHKNSMYEQANIRFHESNGAALKPVQLAFYSKARLARDRIHWAFPYDQDERVSSVLSWIQAVSHQLAAFGLHKFLQTRERGALFTNAKFRLPNHPDEPVFDWMTFDQLTPTMDRILQESVATYDPSVKVVVFVFLPSESGNSMAIWRRKLLIPNNLRLSYTLEINQAMAALRKDSDYKCFVDELPVDTKVALPTKAEGGRKRRVLTRDVSYSSSYSRDMLEPPPPKKKGFWKRLFTVRW